jgi:TetR/AcrR family transcriptional regulator, transcriptional repressor of bet genes
MSRPHREDERKEETIRAVWASVARYGCSGTTIERVAEIAGFSKGVIHYYFDSKKALLLAAFEAYLKAYEDETVALLTPLGREPSAREVLEAIVDSALPPFSPEDLEAAELPLLATGAPLGPRYKARLFVQFYSLIATDQDFARTAANVYARQGKYFVQCFESMSPSSGSQSALSYAAGLVALIDGFSLMRVIGYLPAGLPEHAALVKLLAIEPAVGLSIK